MSYASLAIETTIGFRPIDPRVFDRAAVLAARVGRGLVFAAQSVVLAGVCWLLLAGPGLLTGL